MHHDFWLKSLEVIEDALGGRAKGRMKRLKLCTVMLQSLPAEYIQNQKTVDAALLKSLSAEVKGYLGTRFSLQSGDRPHLLKF